VNRIGCNSIPAPLWGIGDGKPGRWLAKWSAADARTDCGAVKRHHTAIGVADDLGPAEGLTRLSFEQARQKSFAWFTEAAKDDGQGTASDADSLTVKQAVEEYFADCERRGDRLRQGPKQGASVGFDEHFRRTIYVDDGMGQMQDTHGGMREQLGVRREWTARLGIARVATGGGPAPEI
jgi:hypothetical protein